MHYKSYSAVQSLFCFFFFNDTATTEIYTLSLHDALPISSRRRDRGDRARTRDTPRRSPAARAAHRGDRKSTRLNSSHGYISYAVFCLKKKKKKIKEQIMYCEIVTQSPSVSGTGERLSVDC